MKTGTQRTLDKLRLGMSPRQHVFAMIEEARQAGSITEAARNCARNFGREPTVLDRVAQSIVKDMKGQPAVEVNRAARKAQREALYLCKLFRNCNFEVVTHEREWALAGLVSFLGLRSPENDAPFLETTVRFAWMHCFDLEKHRLAFEDVQSTEFGGTDVLLPHERSILTKELSQASRIVETITRVAGDEPWAQPEIPDARVEAKKCAEVWRYLARSEVHGTFGEDWSGMRLALRVLDEATPTSPGGRSDG